MPDFLSLMETFLTEGKTFYRGGGQGSVPSGTAADVIAYEKEELGNDIKVEPGIDPTKISSKHLMWVTETKEAAKEYGEVESVHVDKYKIIARDNYGGILIDINK